MVALDSNDPQEIAKMMHAKGMRTKVISLVLRMYVCACVCVYVCMYVREYVCMYVCM